MPKQAVTYREDELFHRSNLIAWVLFSLAAGSVNAGALKACGNFVTHVTGTMTSMGVDVPDVGLALEYCSVLVAFIAGAILAVFMVERMAAARRQLILLPFLLAFALLMFAAVAGHLGLFGPFGDVVETPGSFALLAILASAMGIQNAAVSCLTKNAIRTTHLTGPTTDLAANIVRASMGNRAEAQHQIRWILLRVSKMAAFVFGAYLSAIYSSDLEYRVFCIGAFALAFAVAFTFARSIAPASSPRLGTARVSIEKE